MLGVIVSTSRVIVSTDSRDSTVLRTILVHIGLEIVLQKNIKNHTVSNVIGTTSDLIMEEAVF